MEINALMMDTTDNVVTCVTEVPAGSKAVYRKGEEICSVVAKENIPYCHKIALTDIPKGGHVIKYGESLGTVSEDIPAGGWVADHNLFSVPRDYDSELAPADFQMCARQSDGAPDLKGFKFWGYRRAEGRPGIRNHVLILPGCACGSESSRIVASQVRGAVNIVFNTGCSDVAANTEMSQKVLTGFACNPNVYGVVIIGLGCETVPHYKLREKIQAMTSKPVVSFGIQDEGGTLKTIEKAVRAARDMAAEAAMQQKELFDISEFLMGIECGGSDATSGIASNPAVGELSDILVDMGATTMMSESIEWIGGEHVLAKRGANKEIHDQIIEVCRAYEEHLTAAGQDCRAGQPTPGNKAGGLSTLDEKSLSGSAGTGSASDQTRRCRHGHCGLRYFFSHKYGCRRLPGHHLHHRPRHPHRQRHRSGIKSYGQRAHLSENGRQHGHRSERHRPGRKDLPGNGAGNGGCHP